MNITVILDTHAMRAYARLETVSVGELIRTVTEDGDTAAVSVCTLIEVWPQLSPPERTLVDDLVTRDGSPIHVLALHAHEASVLAEPVHQHGYACAHTIAAAGHLHAILATTTPPAYQGLLNPDDILDLS